MILSKSCLFLIVIIVLLSWRLSFAAKLDDFTLNDLDNKRTSYSDIKGEKLTVIDFWATWCKPCSREIPALVTMYETFKEQGVAFIGINVDSPRNLPKVKPFANSLGISYPVLLDSNSELMSRLKVTAMPTVLIIDADDEIVYIHRGYRPGDEDKLLEEITHFLLEKPTKKEDEK